MATKNQSHSVVARFLLAAILFAFMPLVFTACGFEEDEDDYDRLAGCWKACDPEDGDVQFYLLLTDEGAAKFIQVVEHSSHPSFEGYWSGNDVRLNVYPANPSEEIDGESWYYRFKGNKLYLYYARSDFDRDDKEDCDFICQKCSISDIEYPENGGNNGDNGGDNGDIDKTSIIGTWSISGYIPDEGEVSTTIEFKKDGTCTISERFASYPEDNYTMTLKYSVDGSLEKGATLKMWGKTADGDSYDASYKATISGKKLTLKGLTGEGAGETLVLTRK